MDSLTEYTIWLPTLALVIVRVLGVFLVAPVFGEAVVPWKVRGFMSVAIALAVVARIAEPVALPTHWIPMVLGLGAELMLGTAIGYVARVVFAGVELGALHIGQQMGLGLAEVYSPAGAATSGIVRRLFQLLAVVLFLAIGGHRMLIGAVLGTFQAIPPMGFAPSDALLGMVASLLGASFLLALKVAAPVLLAMLLATVALGMLQRTLPQCNILSTGLPARAVVGLLAMAGGLAVMPTLVESAWNLTSSHITALVGSGQ